MLDSQIAHLDRHTSGVVSNREQDPLPTHSFETGRKLNLADGESVTKMERTVHVGIRKSTEPFGVLLVNLLHRLAGSEEFRVRVDTLRKRRGVGLKELLLGPRSLSGLFEVNKVISLVGLLQVSRLLYSILRICPPSP